MALCILCGSKAEHLFSTQDPATGNTVHHVHWCQACDLGRLAGEFTPEQISSFYPVNYYTHSNQPKERPRMPFSERLLVHAAWRLDRGTVFSPEETTGKTALDIGCGDGFALRKFKAAGFSTFGIDPDPIARQVAGSAGTILPGTAETLPEQLAGKTFDVVLMSHVLEHCRLPITAIDNAKSLLSADGTLIIEVPNNAAFGFWWFKGRWPWTDAPRHLSFFTEKSLRILLETCGLQITKTIYTGYTRQFDNDWRGRIMSFRSGWPLWLASALSPDRKKYDSIRVHARVH